MGVLKVVKVGVFEVLKVVGVSRQDGIKKGGVILYLKNFIYLLFCN